MDFGPVFDCIRANRAEVDLSPVLTAVQALTNRFGASTGRGKVFPAS